MLSDSVEFFYCLGVEYFVQNNYSLIFIGMFAHMHLVVYKPVLCIAEKALIFTLKNTTVRMYYAL